MPKPQVAKLCSPIDRHRWSLRDFIAAAILFLATAAVVLWQNAHVAVLWDISYILDSSFRIALGQAPYRDFPFAHAPLTFLIQAAIIHLAGRVFFHHVLYAAVAGGLGTVLTWRIALRILQRLQASWPVALLLATPLTMLGITCILPIPFYDSDCVLSILLSILLFERLADYSARGLDSSLSRAFFAGASLTLPLFVKQNIGLPLLLAAFAALFLLLAAKLLRGNRAPSDGSLSLRRDINCTGKPAVTVLIAILAGACAALAAAGLLLHFTVGLRNYFHWTVQFASSRRLPGFKEMLGVYQEPSLLWWLPSVAAALLILHWLGKSLWASLAALGLLSAPFLLTLVNLFFTADPDDSADSLLALWPLLLVLSAALALYKLCRKRGMSALLPIFLLVAIHGTLLSQQLWGSTYAIWPLLVLLIVGLIAELNAAVTFIHSPERAVSVASALAVVLSITMLICGGFYMASEERLSYAKLDEGDALRSAAPALLGLSVPGDYLPGFEELLRFAAAEIPASDGLILIPGEDPFYFATGRVPQFPLLLFDNATDPYSPLQLVEEARTRKIRWLIVKRELQLKEDPTPQRAAVLQALLGEFVPYRELGSYDVYRRP